MTTTIIWIFISTFALILGPTSYKSAKDNWVDCIKDIQADKKTQDYPRIKQQQDTEQEDSHKQEQKNEITDDVSYPDKEF